MLRHNLIARHLTDHRITSTLQMVKQSHYFIEKLQMEIISNEGMHQFEGDLYVGSQPASIQHKRKDRVAHSIDFPIWKLPVLDAPNAQLTTVNNHGRKMEEG